MGTRERLTERYPIFGLEVHTPTVTLRFPDDDDLIELGDVATTGVHPPGEMPFVVPWTRAEPPHLQRNSMDFWWTTRSQTRAADWNATMATVVDGRIVGSQGLMAQAWEVTRTFETGSWLAQRFQGQGIGKEMRAAALHLGFAGFGAQVATTAAYADNPASLAVTRALGYRENGTDRVAREGEAVDLHRFVLYRADWERQRRDDIELVGVEPVVEAFGTAPSG